MSRLLLAPLALIALGANAQALDREDASSHVPPSLAPIHEIKALVIESIERIPPQIMAPLDIEVGDAVYTVVRTNLDSGASLRATSTDKDAELSSANIDVTGKSGKDAKIVSVVATTKNGADIVAFNTDENELSVTVTGKDGRTETFTTTARASDNATGSTSGRTEGKSEAKAETKTGDKKTEVTLYGSDDADSEPNGASAGDELLAELGQEMATDATTISTNDTNPNQTSVSGEAP